MYRSYFIVLALFCVPALSMAQASGNGDQARADPLARSDDRAFKTGEVGSAEKEVKVQDQAGAVKELRKLAMRLTKFDENRRFLVRPAPLESVGSEGRICTYNFSRLMFRMIRRVALEGALVNFSDRSETERVALDTGTTVIEAGCGMDDSFAYLSITTRRLENGLLVPKLEYGLSVPKGELPDAFLAAPGVVWRDDGACVGVEEDSARRAARDRALTKAARGYCDSAKIVLGGTCEVKRKYVFGCFAAVVFERTAMMHGEHVKMEISEGFAYLPLDRTWSEEDHVAMKIYLDGALYHFAYNEEYLLKKAGELSGDAGAVLRAITADLKKGVGGFCDSHPGTCSKIEDLVGALKALGSKVFEKK